MIKKSKKIFFIVLILSLFIQHSAKSWLVAPVRFETKLERGGEYTLAFSVINNSQFQENRFQIKVADWTVTEDDSLQISTPAENKFKVIHSATPWIRVSPKQFLLRPGSTKRVRFTIKVPDELPEGDGDYSSCILVQEKALNPPQMDGAFLNVVQTTRVAVIIYANIGEEKREISLKAINVNNAPIADGLNAVQIIPKFANSGNVHLRGMAELKLTNISYPDIPKEGKFLTTKKSKKGEDIEIRIPPLADIETDIDGGVPVAIRNSNLNYKVSIPNYLPAGSEWEAELKVDFGKKVPVIKGKKKFIVPFLKVPEKVEKPKGPANKLKKEKLKEAETKTPEAKEPETKEPETKESKN